MVLLNTDIKMDLNTMACIFVVLFVILAFIIVYVKNKYGFWIIQPVFHVYDFWYLFMSPTIISKGLPRENKYTNLTNIKTYTSLSDIQTTNMVNFIQSNYHRNGDNIFYPKKDNIVPYFTGHNSEPMFSFYTKQQLMLDMKTGNTIDDNSIIGIMTTRPSHVRLKSLTFDVNYVDYLCVDVLNRNQGIAPQLIQTHNYNMLHMTNNKRPVSLFKREDQLTGIVPLCIFSTYGYSLDRLRKTQLHSRFKIESITKKNYHMLHSFLNQHVDHDFDLVVMAESSNIVTLLDTNNIFISVLLTGNEIVAAYFFRKTCVTIEANKEVLTCIGSVNHCETDDVFVKGFKMCFWEISNKFNFKYLAIENISHNHYIVDTLKPALISPTAYFFYNYACNSIPSHRALVIN